MAWPPAPAKPPSERGHDLGRSTPTADSRAWTDKSSSSLTPRQREVAALVAAGMSNAAIAEQLGLTKGTVANHLATILSRLQLSSRTELAVWATEHDLHAGHDR